MALSGKNISGYSKIEALDFSTTAFTDPGAQVFKDEEVVAKMQQISSKLSEIANTYDLIRKGYKKCLNDTATGKPMAADNTDGKKIRKFKDKADKRADYIMLRKQSLASEISTLKLMIDMINSRNDATQDASDSNISSVED